MVEGDNGLRTPLSSVSSAPGSGKGGAEDLASGWQYGVDFGTLANQGSSKKSMGHFVRRRKLTCTIRFDGEQQLSDSCPCYPNVLDASARGVTYIVHSTRNSGCTQTDLLRFLHLPRRNFDRQ